MAFLTLTKPLFNSRLANDYFEKGFIAVDMESFFIKDKYPDSPFIPLLAGTDRGDKKSIIDFFKNLSFASSKLMQVKN